MGTRADPDGSPADRPQTGLGEFSARRVVIVAGVLVVLGAIFELAVRRSLNGALSLTGAGGVAIINFRWLEALLQRVIQPGRPSVDRWSVLRFLGRMALFAAMIAALFWVPRVDFIAVALGFSAFVLALVAEGVRWARVGGGG